MREVRSIRPGTNPARRSADGASSLIWWLSTPAINSPSCSPGTLRWVHSSPSSSALVPPSIPLPFFCPPVPSLMGPNASYATSASRVSHLFPLSTLASLHSQVLPLRYRQPVRASISAIFTMEGLIERDATTFCNVKATLGRMSDYARTSWLSHGRDCKFLTITEARRPSL